MRKLATILCLSALTSIALNEVTFDLNTWMKRGVHFQKKFKTKCAAGCVFNYDFIMGVWEQYREGAEALFDTAGVEEDIYPGLLNKIMDNCVSRDPKINYCEPEHLTEFVKCVMPIMQPYIPRLIELAKKYIAAIDAVYDAVEPELEKWVEDLKC